MLSAIAWKLRWKLPLTFATVEGQSGLSRGSGAPPGRDSRADWRSTAERHRGRSADPLRARRATSVLLEPKKGTQGREMNRTIRIAPTLALAGALFVSAPSVALAGSPLLSGYGGPGAGEQAIVGSTLIGGPRGGAGSGGSSGSRRSTGAGREGSGGSTSNGSGGALAGAARSKGGSGSSAGAAGKGGGASQAGHAGGAQAGGANANAYVYPGSLRSAASDSPVLGISGGDMLLFVATIATLTLIGTLTRRLGRLQR
jgi:hypothetical protein